MMISFRIFFDPSFFSAYTFRWGAGDGSDRRLFDLVFILLFPNIYFHLGFIFFIFFYLFFIFLNFF